MHTHTISTSDPSSSAPTGDKVGRAVATLAAAALVTSTLVVTFSLQTGDDGVRKPGGAQDGTTNMAVRYP